MGEGKVKVERRRREKTKRVAKEKYSKSLHEFMFIISRRNEWQLHKEVKEEPVIKHFAYRWKEYVDVLKQQDIKVRIV